MARHRDLRRLRSPEEVIFPGVSAHKDPELSGRIPATAIGPAASLKFMIDRIQPAQTYESIRFQIGQASSHSLFNNTVYRIAVMGRPIAQQIN